MKGLYILTAIMLIVVVIGCQSPGVSINPAYDPLIDVGARRIGEQIAIADPVLAVSIKNQAQAVVDATDLSLDTAVRTLSAEIIKILDSTEDPQLTADVEALLAVFNFEGGVKPEATAYIKKVAAGLVKGINIGLS